MITFVYSIEKIEPAMLAGFFDGWPNPPSVETHLKLMRKSYRAVLAMDGEKVVGFITAISDGVLSAYFPLLEVLPEYKGRGIGKELTTRMLEELQGLYMVDLLCDAGVQPFYQKQGMRRATGMFIRNYDRQNGE